MLKMLIVPAGCRTASIPFIIALQKFSQGYRDKGLRAYPGLAKAALPVLSAGGVFDDVGYGFAQVLVFFQVPLDYPHGVYDGGMIPPACARSF